MAYNAFLPVLYGWLLITWLFLFLMVCKSTLVCKSSLMMCKHRNVCLGMLPCVDWKPNRNNPPLQSYAALGPTLLTICLGMAEGFSAIFLPQLLLDKNWEIDTNMESWIASIATLPMPFACLVGGWAMESMGRKSVHIINCLFAIIGWSIIFYSNGITSILVGRFITGMCVGFTGPVTGAYFAETADPTFRGVCLALVGFAISFGILLSHMLGTIMTWRLVALVCCIFPTVGLICMLFAPESPTYLIKKNKFEFAREAFYWCRGNDPQSEKELQTMIDRQTSTSAKKCLDYSIYVKPEFVKPLFILFIYFFVLQWCGSNAITFYTVDILKMSLGNEMDEYLSMIIMDSVRLVFSILALYLQKKLPRRPHSFITITGVFLSLATLSGCLYASKFYPIILEKYNLIVLIAFLSYMAFLSGGVNPLPWTIIGEVFPLASKGVGSGISSCVNFIFLFSVVKTTPFLFKTLGTDGTFGLFAASTFIGLILLVVFLPETRGKTLHEIEDRFKRVKKTEI